MGAARIGQILAGKGRIAEVAVQPGSASTMAREQGFEEALAKDFPGIKIVDKQYGMADFGQSLKVAENMLTAAPDMNGMFASNESSAVGAVRALKDKKGVKLVGFDSSPQLIEALKRWRGRFTGCAGPVSDGVQIDDRCGDEAQGRVAGAHSEHCADAGDARQHGYARDSEEDQSGSG